MVTALAPLIAPPIAGSPTPFETGRDSPVNIASLKQEAPSRMLPSTGPLAPGRTSTWSPGIKAEIGTSWVAPLAWMRDAVSGQRRTSVSNARYAPQTPDNHAQRPRHTTQ